ncbi:hypothetical protein [Micromonospora sicca]|uniref:hypothetical protein n=1 Tax=Micromonospora sicca TaxID=2202420 RepID=UPI0011B64F5F|nr:hypothetical protein [Micromonospora sp. 4G51]
MPYLNGIAPWGGGVHVELGVAQHGERHRDGGPPVGVLARVQPLASDDPRPAVPAHVLHQMYRADPVEIGVGAARPRGRCCSRRPQTGRPAPPKK